MGDKSSRAQGAADREAHENKGGFAPSGAPDSRARLWGGRAAYAAVWGISAVLAFLWGGVVPFTLFYLLLAVPVLSLLQAWGASCALRYTQRLVPDRVMRGQDAALVLTIQNSSRLLPAVYVELTLLETEGLSADVPRRYVISLLPRQSKRIELPVRFRYRGVYPLGFAKIRIRDLFNLFRLPVSKRPPLWAVSHPELIALSGMLTASRGQLPDGWQQQSGWDETAETSDTRRFQYGDALSRIHWNQTAQRNELITRLYERETHIHTLVLLDLRRSETEPSAYLPREDCIIHACLAVLCFFFTEHKAVLFRCFRGEERREIHERAGGRTNAFYALLSEADFDAVRPPGELMDNTLGETRNVVVFSTAMSPDEAEDFRQNLPSGCRLDIYLTKPDKPANRAGRAEQRAPNPGGLHILIPGDDLRRQLEAVL